jgi:hypothetical protein
VSLFVYSIVPLLRLTQIVAGDAMDRDDLGIRVGLLWISSLLWQVFGFGAQLREKICWFKSLEQ